MCKHITNTSSEIVLENSVLGGEIKNLLSAINFDMQSLPSDIKDEFQIASAIIKSEGLTEMNETILRLCLQEKKILNKSKEREKRQLRASCNAIYAKYKTFQEKVNRLQTAVQAAEASLHSHLLNDEEKESNRILWTKKLHDYKQTIARQEEELKKLQDVDICEIMRKSTILSEKMDEHTEMNKWFDKYGELPPNLLQAKHVLDLKRQELEEVERQIQLKLDN